MSDDPGAAQADREQRLQTELNYAWSWFQYHAQQRLTAFNFLLIVVGVVAVAYSQAVEKGWDGVGVAVGALGALIATGFLMLDVRNEELVDCGRAALERLELQLGVCPSHEAGQRVQLAQTGWIGTFAVASVRRTGWISHSRWLRIIEGAVALAFVVAAAWAATGFAGA